MKRKSLLIVCLATILVLSLVGACAAPAPAPAPTPAPAPAPVPEQPVLKIGIPLPFTGVVAESAREEQDIWRMYIDEQGGTLGGIPVELIFEDTETQAEMVVTKTEKLIWHDEVHLLSGPMLAFECAAMRDSVTRAKIAHVAAGTAFADLQDVDKIPYVANPVWGSFASQTIAPGEYAYEEFGWRKVAMIGQDYMWGWETTAGFQWGFERQGGKVVQKLWAPIGTVDYAPFVTQLRTDVDAIWATLIGADVLRFVKAYSEHGLKDKIPLIGSEDFAGQDAIRYYGDEAIGIISCLFCPPTLDRPEMQEFVRKNQERFDRIPSFWADMAWNNVMFIDRTLWKLRDEGVPPEQLPELVRNDPLRLLATMKTVELPDAPSGHLRMDEHNCVIKDLYLVKLVKKEGEIVSEPFHVFKGQHRLSKPEYEEELFSGPGFSREWPPVIHE